MIIKSPQDTCFDVGDIVVTTDGRFRVTSTNLEVAEGYSYAQGPLETYFTLPAEVTVGQNVLTSIMDWLLSEEGPYHGYVVSSQAEFELIQAKRALRAIIKTRRSEMEFSGLNTSFGVVDSDSDSQRRVSGAVQMAMLALDQRYLAGDSGPTFADTFFPTGFNLYWRFKDNTILQLTPEQVIEMGVQVGKQVAQIAMVKNLLDAQVNAAIDVENLAPVEALALTNWLTIPLA